MRSEELDIDQLIDANMTVTDHLLRDAIRGVVIDAMNKAAERIEELERITGEVEYDPYDPKYWHKGDK
jgi:tetrahydromethanopterin S-methyltransferase subunit B